MPAYRNRDFFVYSVLYATIVSGQSQSASINFEQDSDFSLDKTAYFVGVNNEAATRELAQATVTLQDTGSGRYLMNGPVALTAIFGTGQLPFILPEPKIFVARSTLLIAVANYGGTDLVNLYLTFIGTKLFL